MYKVFVKGALINQILQNNNLKIYLLRFVLWFIMLLFLRICCLNSLCLEHNIEDVRGVVKPLNNIINTIIII